ncbi:hypothetical protein FJT64_025385 [Amphibalanus amphitrite]|uniref:Gustatory receptor n=1 Tax=Amphibalanus amphitrite TaxID=1232801 RepID=A0A6A4W8Y4_AMPAM|nr:hypothetical protein FJT64_025385 [Amphibalanus amphitrite]
MRIRFLRVGPSPLRSPADSSEPGDANCADERIELPSGACRSFVRLLSAAGLLAGRGWTPVVGALVAFVIHSVVGFTFAIFSLEAFREDQRAGEPFFRSFFQSNFIGIPLAMIYLSLMLSLAVGRRRYSRVLSELCSVLKEFEHLPQPVTSRLRPSTIGAAMWALTAGVTAIYFATKVHTIVWVCKVIPPPVGVSHHLSCTEWVALTIGLAYSTVSFALIAMKFVLAGLLLAHGLQLVNGRLEVLAAAPAAADTTATAEPVGVEAVAEAAQADVTRVEAAAPPLSDEAELRRLGRLHRRLSEVTSSLCSALSPELMMLSAVAVLSQVMLAALLFYPLRDMAFLLRYLPLAAVAMGGPCETCQQLLNQLDAGRRLLLRLEWHRPQLGSAVGPLLRNIEHDLETVGDLGLFRLRRSTLLSVWSTIVTYVIVMAQFKMSETQTAGAP